MLNEHEPYPERCPLCHEPTGWPYAAGTCDRLDIIVVKLRCGHCGQAWESDAPQGTAALGKSSSPGISCTAQVVRPAFVVISK